MQVGRVPGGYKSSHMTIQKFLFLFVLASSTLAACKDDDTPAVDANNSQYVNPVPGLAEGAVLITVTANSSAPAVPGVPNIDFNIDVPVGLFYNSTNLVAAGLVSIDGKNLENLNNVYTLGAGIADPTTGLFAYDKRAWTVGGQGNVPAISATPARVQPSLGAQTAPEELVKNQPYTVTVASINNADSVYFTLGAEVIKRFRGNVRSYTFTADETNRVQPQDGQTVAQVVAFTIERKDQGSFPVYLIGEAVRNKFVTVK